MAQSNGNNGDQSLSKKAASTILEELTEELAKELEENNNKNDKEEQLLKRKINFYFEKLNGYLAEATTKITNENYTSGKYNMFSKAYNNTQDDIWENFRNYKAEIKELTNEQIIIHVFIIINQIIPLLRQFLLNLKETEAETILLISKFNNVTQYTKMINESDLDENNLQISKVKDKKGNIIEVIQYKLNTLEDSYTQASYYTKAEKDVTYKGFFKHYEKFKKVAERRKKITDEEGREKYSYNEGHIVEAYYRHLEWVKKHRGWRDNFSKVTENECEENRFTFHQIVYISLYYSVGNDPWWTGGDVGNLQIKGKNTQLTSAYSVKVVANELIRIWEKYNDTNSTKKDKKEIKEEFKRIFQRDQTETIFTNAIKKEMLKDFEQFEKTHDLKGQAGDKEAKKAIQDIINHIKGNI